MTPETSVPPSSSPTSGHGIPPPPDQSTVPGLDPAGPPAHFPDPDGYRLEEQLGAGGMGVVFAAVQVALHRAVAVKFLRTDGLHRPDLLARFRTEAAALARAAHPNIVQVFEVGEADGRPFLVLEYVAGGSLSDKLAAGPLPPRPAAELLRPIAAAVHAAHAAGIVHRDLKPGNVLLTPDGTPKVTDFGLAKPLADAAGDTPLETGATRTGVVLGTPSYMAPEQATGLTEAVGPAADVYALGVILYECLTGRVPFRAASVIETLNLVAAADPPPPRQLQPGVPKDLETICLKCLRKSPAQRYPSAQALADDLGRFLAGEPIVARPVGRAERAAKWCRRNPTAAALAAVGVVALAAGAGGVVVHNARLQAALDAKTAEEAKARREKDRADENYKAARQAVRQMLARVEDRKYAEVPRLRELHKAQAEAALAYFRTVAGQRDDPSPEVRYDAAKADFEAGRLYHALGDRGPAADYFRRALEGFDRLLAADPDHLHFRAERANTRAHLANLAGNREESIRQFAEARAELEEVAAHPGATFEHKSTLANITNTLGTAYIGAGKYAAAEPYLLAAYDLRRELAAGREGDREITRLLAENMSNLSSVYRLTNRPGPAAEYHDRCEAALQKLVDEDPTDRQAVTSLAVERVNWTYVLIHEKRLEEAVGRLTRTLPPLERLHRLEPNDAGVRDALFRVYGIRGQVCDLLGRYADAAKDCERVVAVVPAGKKRYHRWFLARARARAGDYFGSLAESEALLAEVGPGVPEGEPRYGAVTCAAVAGDLWAAAAVGSAAAAAGADRAERLAVALLGKVKAAAGPVNWLKVGFEVGGDPAFRGLWKRDDYKKLMAGK